MWISMNPSIANTADLASFGGASQLPVAGGTAPTAPAFVDRRQSHAAPVAAGERRQFASSHLELSPAARELALAIDGYKARNRRRFITFEEMLQIISQLGYHKS
jgi:hypothetical protein